MTPQETSELQLERVASFAAARWLGRRIVALSGGKDSTAMALRLAEAATVDEMV